MPQMSPINWLSLLFMFCLTYLMFNILNYFSYLIINTNYNKNKMLNLNCNKTNKKFNWKW